MLDLVIIGAGPYGISVAAHAAARNLSYKLLGYPMDFWRNQMPQNMFIRTPPDLASFSDPEGEFTIQKFSSETKIELVSPLPRTVFVQYSLWFVEKTGVEFTPDIVTSLKQNDEVYTVHTEGGQHYAAKHIVIATGIKEFQYIPTVFKELPSDLVSHTLGYTSFEQFQEKDITIIGSGQSAWEAAALLYEAKANVQLVYRSKAPVYGGSRAQEVLLRGFGRIFYRFPRRLKDKLLQIGSVTVPIAHFLRPYVEGKVPQISGVTIEQAIVTGNRVHLQLSNGDSLVSDHVIVASGFKIDLDRLDFIDDQLKYTIAREVSYKAFPKLNQNFESSSKGLYFAGPLSSQSHGPTFRFILGLDKTARSIIKSVSSLSNP